VKASLCVYIIRLLVNLSVRRRMGKNTEAATRLTATHIARRTSHVAHCTLYIDLALAVL
jgi:hypothetical protein